MAPRPRPSTSSECEDTPFCPYIVEIREQFRSLDGRLSGLSSSQTRIEQAIIGDKSMGLKGLVDRQDETDSRITKNNAKLDKLDHKLIYWGGFVASTAVFCGYLLQKIYA